MGFDTCTAPSLHAMRMWRPAFSAVAIYIGGPEAACGWGNLSRRWVRVTTHMGWGLIPTYVGRQAPCTRFKLRVRPGHAKRQGRQAARAAVHLVHALGIRRHAPLYYDMEAYKRHRPHCRRPVLAFLSAWTRALHRHHYRSGVYSSAGSAVRDLGRTWRVYGRRIAKPNSLWFGLWDQHRDLSGVPYVLDSWWRGGHRIKQYRGPHHHRVNGVRLDIDTDWVAGPVYRGRR